MKVKAILRWSISAALICGFLLVIGGSIWAFYTYFNSGESTDKSEWSVLQGVEFDNRNASILNKITVKKVDADGSAYSVLGVKAKDGSKVWILLNPKGNLKVKQLPDASYTLSLADIKEIQAIQDIDPAVMAEIRQHVAKSAP